MSAEITSVCRAEDAQPYVASAEERGSLGTLCWQRVAKIAGLAGAVAALVALSVAAGHLVQAVPPQQAHSTSVVSTQQAPAAVP